MVSIPLQKYIAGCGVASRRQAERLISDGQVTVNGAVATLGVHVNPDTDEVRLGETPLKSDSKVYLVVNKPAGVLTTSDAESGRETIYSCVKGVKSRVFPVGRLGLEEEGAIILTNDGALSHRLLLAEYNVEGVYLAWVEGSVDEDTVVRCEQGVSLSDELNVRLKILVLYTGVRTTLVRLTIREGKRLSVRRVCAAVGHPVLEIRRIAFANVNVEGLKPGEWRWLTDEEIASLHRLTESV